MRSSVWDKISYRLLKSLSHTRNKMTNEQISRRAIADTYEPYKADLFIGYLGKYLDYQGKAVLDVGCGTGNLCLLLALTGAKRVVGIDIDAERVETAYRLADEQGVSDKVEFKTFDFNDYQPMIYSI